MHFVDACRQAMKLKNHLSETETILKLTVSSQLLQKKVFLQQKIGYYAPDIPQKYNLYLFSMYVYVCV